MPKAAPAEDRVNAVVLASQVGVSEAARETGFDKGTISKWLKSAGLSTVASERTRAAIEAVKLNGEQRRTRLADRLLEIAEHSVERELELIQSADLRDVVGARTRAIHDAQLLTGGPTQSIQNLRSIEEAVDELAQRRKLKSVA